MISLLVLKYFCRADVEEQFDHNTWQRAAYEDYVRILLDKQRIFPCIYATKGYNGDEQRFVFADSDDLSTSKNIRALAQALSSYLPKSRALGPNTSLVLLCKLNPTPRAIEEYHSEFWKLLDGVAQLDNVPWPSHIPKDVDTDNWCFCYNGQPFFSVVQTPAHQVRQSRHAPGLTIVFQVCYDRTEFFS